MSNGLVKAMKKYLEQVALRGGQLDDLTFPKLLSDAGPLLLRNIDCHVLASGTRGKNQKKSLYVTLHLYRLDWPRTEKKWPAFVTRLLNPRSRKSGHCFFWGVDQDSMPGAKKKLF